jgi:GT2 family glycosyltransferase
MIPSYNPGPFLKETLQSVLCQDVGPEQMQVAVVDDASPNNAAAEIIEQLGVGDRIELHRSPINVGLAGNWNRCIDLARGEIVHILHQDDIVLHGFYERLAPAFSQQPEIGMAFTRHALVGSALQIERRSHRERWWAGPVRNWLRRIVAWDCIQCPAVVVRRSVYERLGGYRQDLVYSLDWEMWVRIAAMYPVWFEPRLLAYFRRHESSTSNQLYRAGKTFSDLLKTIDIFAEHLPSAERARLLQSTYAEYLRRHLKQLERMPASDKTIDVNSLIQPIREVITRCNNPRIVATSNARLNEIAKRWQVGE